MQFTNIEVWYTGPVKSSGLRDGKIWYSYKTAIWAVGESEPVSRDLPPRLEDLSQEELKEEVRKRFSPHIFMAKHDLRKERVLEAFEAYCNSNDIKVSWVEN